MVLVKPEMPLHNENENEGERRENSGRPKMSSWKRFLPRLPGFHLKTGIGRARATASGSADVKKSWKRFLPSRFLRMSAKVTPLQQESVGATVSMEESENGDMIESCDSVSDIFDNCASVSEIMSEGINKSMNESVKEIDEPQPSCSKTANERVNECMSVWEYQSDISSISDIIDNSANVDESVSVSVGDGSPVLDKRTKFLPSRPRFSCWSRSKDVKPPLPPPARRSCTPEASINNNGNLSIYSGSSVYSPRSLDSYHEPDVHVNRKKFISCLPYCYTSYGTKPPLRISFPPIRQPVSTCWQLIFCYCPCLLCCTSFTAH